MTYKEKLEEKKARAKNLTQELLNLSQPIIQKYYSENMKKENKIISEVIPELKSEIMNTNSDLEKEYPELRFEIINENSQDKAEVQCFINDQKILTYTVKDVFEGKVPSYYIKIGMEIQKYRDSLSR